MFASRVIAAASLLGSVLALPVAVGSPTALAIAAAPSIAARPVILKPSNGQGGDDFGGLVAVSGHTIVVGLPEATAPPGEEAPVADVYVRPAAGWRSATQTAQLKAPASSDESSVGDVAIAGNTIVVGDTGYNSGKGAVLVYTRPARGWRTTASPTAVLTASDGNADDVLGTSVAISGHTIVAGATNHGPPATAPGTKEPEGAAYVFSEPSSGWHSETQGAELTNATPQAQEFGEEFGACVAVSGNVVAVGAPEYSQSTLLETGLVSVFVRPGSTWHDAQPTRNLQAKTPVKEAQFGCGLAVTSSGHTVIAGYPDNLTSLGHSAALVFIEPTGGWKPPLGATTSPAVTPTATLTATDGADLSSFPYPVSASGRTVVAGGRFQTQSGGDPEGAAYVYDEPTQGWKTATQNRELGKTGPSQGFLTGAVAVDGATIVAGAPARNADIGEVYVYAPAPPRLSAVTQSHPTWRIGVDLPKVNPTHPSRAGTRLAFVANEAATVSIVFSRTSRGRAVTGILHIAAQARHNTIQFDGVLRAGRTLPAGSYRVSFSAENANGSSPDTILHFTALPRTPNTRS
jgi:FG-GAP repeat